MDFLKQLTDPALKRLYKFILKRFIGRFLRDELDLEQLEVSMHRGAIELTDLQLCEDALNDAVASLEVPIRIASGFLGRVKAKLCYTNILEESLTIELDGLTLVALPPLGEKKSQSSDKDTDEGEGHEQARCSGEGEAGDLQAREGLDFLASWIEKITSKIKIKATNLELRLKSSESDSSYIVIRAPAIDFSDEQSEMGE